MKNGRLYHVWNDGLSVVIDVTELAKVEVILSDQVVKLLFRGNNQFHVINFQTPELAKTIGDGVIKVWSEYWREKE